VLDSLRANLFSRPTFWKFNFLVWFGFGLIATMIRFVMHEDLHRAIALTLGAETLGFLLSGVLRAVYLRFEGKSFFKAHVLGIATLLTLVLAALQSGIVHFATQWANWQIPAWTPLERWVLLSVSMWLVYMAWSLGYFWLKAEMSAATHSLRAAQARAEAHRLEAQLLRAQLDPHFLFNSLNGISAEISPHPDRAKSMVHELGDYLRFSLEHRHEVTASLAVELDATAAYMRVEKARFGERIQTSIEADPEARKKIVPSFLLQPLVENAVKHGFAFVVPPWKLAIVATASADTLTIEVANSGDAAHPQHGGGVGLDTIRRRLELHYPQRHRFELVDAGGMVIVRMFLKGEPCFA